MIRVLAFSLGTMDEHDAYHEGRLAAMVYKPASYNPYPPRSAKREQWSAGFQRMKQLLEQEHEKRQPR
ncbi:ribosome modulation factor [Enterococcus faecium]